MEWATKDEVTFEACSLREPFITESMSLATENITPQLNTSNDRPKQVAAKPIHVLITEEREPSGNLLVASLDLGVHRQHLLWATETHKKEQTALWSNANNACQLNTTKQKQEHNIWRLHWDDGKSALEQERVRNSLMSSDCRLKLVCIPLQRSQLPSPLSEPGHWRLVGKCVIQWIVWQRKKLLSKHS